jgi:hypothetical protein
MSHIPRVLYHWRASATSTSIAHDQKPYAHDAGRPALQQSIERSELDGRVEGRDLNHHYRIELDLPAEPSVAVLFHTREGGRSPEWLKAKTDYQNCDFLSAQSTDQNSTAVMDRGKAAIFKQLIDQSESEYIALLGNGAERITRNWLRELVSKFRLDAGIGISCGRVQYSGTDGPSYTVANLENNSVPYYMAFLDAAARHASGLQNLQFINGCNWHICVIKRSLWKALEGFDVDCFPHHLSMLDLCYRATDQASKILYTPDAMVDYLESGQPPRDERGTTSTERELFQKRHWGQLQQNDLWYNSQHMVDRGISRKDFYRWLAGNS